MKRKTEVVGHCLFKLVTPQCQKRSLLNYFVCCNPNNICLYAVSKRELRSFGECEGRDLKVKSAGVDLVKLSGHLSGSRFLSSLGGRGKLVSLYIPQDLA